MAHSAPWKKLSSVSIPAEDLEVGLGHMVPVATYNKILAALLLLTGLTVGAAFFHFGALNEVIALVIATTKAALVVMIFMHVKFEKKMIVILTIYPLFILALMIVGTLGDAVTRDPIKPNQTMTAE